MCFMISFMNRLTKQEINLLWRKCEHIAHSGVREWRFDENGFPIRLCDYLRENEKGGWFIREDENHSFHICSYSMVRTLL